MLLTDGTVMVHNPLTRQWWRFSPDANGSYQNGTWSQMGSMSADFGPLYFGSAVLRDGRVVVCGGEYNLNGTVVYQAKCAVYNSLTNAWTNFAPPAGWDNIGDTQLTVLPDGKVVIAELFDTRMAVLDPTTLTWTALQATNKIDRHHEEGWTLLPDGSMLTIDTINVPHAEKYIPSLDAWFSAGSLPVALVDVPSKEIGPAVLLPNGTVFCTGATGHNAIYHPGTQPSDPGTWTVAPDFPNIGGQLDIADGPACLLPNGNVLCATSPGIYHSPTHFFEFNGTSMLTVGATPRSATNPSYVGNMLMLPTGQVFYTDLSNDVEIYTPTGGPQDSWRPVITSCPTTIGQSLTFVLHGQQLNGLSECSFYGDDSTNATNYPLVRITNNATGHVKYCRTRDHSVMAVATGNATVSTTVDVPSTIETGFSRLEVVTNGIASAPLTVVVTAPNVVLPTTYTLVRGLLQSGNLESLFFTDNSSLVASVGLVLTAAEPPVQIKLTGTALTATPSSLKFTHVSKVSSVGTTEKVQLFNYVTGQYEVLDTRSGSTSYQTVTVTASGDLSRFVDPATKQVQALVTYLQTGPVTNVNWQVSSDTSIWTIN